MKIIDIPRSGSYADKTSSRNRGGQYVRNRRSPVQPIGTGRRALVRARLGAASSAWGGLSDAQRDAWAAYADANPYTDRLGQSIKLTGHQIFVAIRANCANAGLAAPTAPPVSNVTPALSAVTFYVDIGDQEALVEFTSTGSNADKILVSTAPPVSAGRSRPSYWWQAAVASGDAPGEDIYAVLVLQFGAPGVGQRVFVKLTPVNQYGVVGTPTILSAIATA